MNARAFTQVTRQFVEKELGPQARSALLADIAQKGSAELIRTGRASPNFRRFVDGREGAQENTVKPDGVIVYEFSWIGEIATFVLAFLRARSPVRSGRFRDSFVVSVDGRPIPAAEFQPSSVPLKAEIFIYNTQPYSRKVDVQLRGGKALRFSVPAGLYDDAVRAVNRQYGNVTKAERVYSVTFPGQYTLRRGINAGRRVNSPAIQILPVE